MRILATLILIAIILVTVVPAMASPNLLSRRVQDEPTPIVLLTTRLYNEVGETDLARPVLASLSGHTSRIVIGDGKQRIVDLTFLPTVRTDNLLTLRITEGTSSGSLFALRPNQTRTLVLSKKDGRMLDVTATVLTDRQALERAMAVKSQER